MTHFNDSYQMSHLSSARQYCDFSWSTVFPVKTSMCRSSPSSIPSNFSRFHKKSQFFSSTSGVTPRQNLDRLNGWTRNLFREMVKFSSFQKILVPSDSASNITPMVKFWVAWVLSVRRNRRKRGTDIINFVYGETRSKSKFFLKLKVAADSPWKTVGP